MAETLTLVSSSYSLVQPGLSGRHSAWGGGGYSEIFEQDRLSADFGVKIFKFLYLWGFSEN